MANKIEGPEEMSRATDTMIRGMDSESIKKYLFKKAMKSDWEGVVQAYIQNERARKARITKSGDTALHIAVLDGQEDCVEELVKLVSLEELKLQNQRGNTPLHFAAAQGNVRMCKCIAKDHSLVNILNKDKETPLFLAALHGKKDAFLCLHYIRTPNKPDPKYYSYCRRGEDGNTILHYAILGDYFDLAFQIIALYKDLVHSVNKDGFSPLHLLADKPSAFMSGSHLNPWTKIIYYCILVDKLNVEEADHFHERVTNTILNKEKAPKYPENYKTCISFLLVFWKMARVFEERRQKESTDLENPEETTEGNSGPYNTCFNFVKLLSKAMLIVVGSGSTEIQKIRNKKEKHKWAIQIMDKLLESALMYENEDSGMNPLGSSHKDGETRPYIISHGGDIEGPTDQDENKGKGKGSWLTKSTEKKTPETETPILIAAKNGVTEMVEKILEHFPVALYDVDSKGKNIVLLAAENKQTNLYQLLLNKSCLKREAREFSEVDIDWNSALHLAAGLGNNKAWRIVGPALQMQWEVKWFEYVKTSMGANFFFRFNKANKTAEDIFTESHFKLFQEAVEWVSKTSQTCSFVASFIATVSFSTVTTIPGGIKEGSGLPVLADQPAFDVYAVSTLFALCFSMTSMFIFLSILLSQYQQKDFATEFPWKLLLGLTSLFVSTVSMMVSFCAGHFFMLKYKLGSGALPIYAMTCLPVAYFVVTKFPLYISLISGNFNKVPVQRTDIDPL